VKPASGLVSSNIGKTAVERGGGGGGVWVGVGGGGGGGELLTRWPPCQKKRKNCFAKNKGEGGGAVILRSGSKKGKKRPASPTRRHQTLSLANELFANEKRGKRKKEKARRRNAESCVVRWDP